MYSVQIRFFSVLRLFCALLLVSSTSAQALEYESLSHLKSIASSFVSERIEHKENERMTVDVSGLNENTHLSLCQSNIEASFNQGNDISQSNAVVLQCLDKPSWTIYVPVTVRVFTQVISASRSLSPGDIITEQDIEYGEMDKNHLYDGFFRDKDEVLGLSPTKILSPGTPLTKKNIKQIALIKKNQAMTLLVRKGSFEIAMIGIAKTDGFLNNPVKVLNPTSKKIIDAIVTGPDTAQLVY